MEFPSLCSSEDSESLGGIEALVASAKGTVEAQVAGQGLAGKGEETLGSSWIGTRNIHP